MLFSSVVIFLSKHVHVTWIVLSFVENAYPINLDPLIEVVSPWVNDNFRSVFGVTSFGLS